jgi:hypothetical protein
MGVVQMKHVHITGDHVAVGMTHQHSQDGATWFHQWDGCLLEQPLF